MRGQVKAIGVSYLLDEGDKSRQTVSYLLDEGASQSNQRELPPG